MHADEASLSRLETWALVGCQPLAQLSNQALLPSLGDMRADLNLTYAELGWVVASFGIARLVVDLPAGNLAARWNPRSLLIAALALSALGLGRWRFGPERLADLDRAPAHRRGLGDRPGNAAGVDRRRLGSRRARGTVLARSEAFFSLTGLFIPALGGLLAGFLGWRVAFVLGALGAGIGLLAIIFGTRASSAARAVGHSLAREKPMAPAGCAAAVGRQGAPGVLRGHVRRVLLSQRHAQLGRCPCCGAEQFGFTPFEIGLLFSVINALGMGAVLLAGKSADRFGRYRVLVPSLAFLTLAQALLLTVHDATTYIVVGLVLGLTALRQSVADDRDGRRARPTPARARDRGVSRDL